MTKKRTAFLALLTVTLLLVIAGIALANVQQGVTIDWFTFGSAGSSAQSLSGQVGLDSTFGQTIAGFATADQGVALSSGYWYDTALESYTAYLPIVIR